MIFLMHMELESVLGESARSRPTVRANVKRRNRLRGSKGKERK